MAEEIQNSTADRTLNSINIIAGIYLIVAPFILGYGSLTRAVTNDVVVGILVVILGAISLVAMRSSAPRWLNAVLGAWLILSAFILGYSGTSQALWNDIIVGVVVLVLSIWSASTMASRQGGRQMRTQ
jgi:hypothetical protein